VAGAFSAAQSGTAETFADWVQESEGFARGRMPRTLPAELPAGRDHRIRCHGPAVIREQTGGRDRIQRPVTRTRRVEPGPRQRNGVRMEIETTRFGRMEVNDQRIIVFPKGLLGFPEHTRFALIQTGEENYFFWLQSLDEPTLAFVVTDPGIFFKDFEFSLKEETQQALQMTDMGFAQVFVICNKVGEWLTGNLQGPLVINAQNRIGEQIVLNDKKWTTRQPLLRLGAEMALAKSA
jgi:flagellar assembly factor FliW